MKRFNILLAALLTAVIVSAFDMGPLRQLGLPAKAIPASYYFDNLYEDQRPAITAQDVNNSSFVGIDDEYTFFVEILPVAEDDLYMKINLWMYEHDKNRVTKIFSQQDKEYEELFIMGFDWLLDKRSTFHDKVISDSKQTIQEQEFTGSPVVVLKAEIFTGFMHAPRRTLLVYPHAKQVKVLKDEVLVSVCHTLTNMLMNAECDKAQDYIITTSTAMRSEEQSLKESQECTIYNKQYLTPTIHIYNARGDLVREVTLPEDEVDMIR